MNTTKLPELWPPDITLERDGIRLEPLTAAHEAGIALAAADGELWNLRFTGVPEPTETASWIAAAGTGRTSGIRQAFAVIDAASGAVIGSTGFHDMVPAIKRVEIGHTWYAKSRQRSNVNTLCKLMLMQHAFETLGCAVVGWRVSHMNFPSQRAVERLGAKRDGVLRHHAPIRDGKVRDTVMYSMLADEWPAAKEKLEARLSAGPHDTSAEAGAKQIRLVEIDAANLVRVINLNPGAIGSRMVAPNAMTIAQSFVSPNAWLRAIYVDDAPVGLVMLFDPTLDPVAATAKPAALDSLYVWRLMIDFAHQSRGYGEQALRRMIERARSMPGIKTVSLSYVMAEGNAKPFYERLGFQDTGKIDSGEMEMVLHL
jgi:N-acetyltransferase